MISLAMKTDIRTTYPNIANDEGLLEEKRMTDCLTDMMRSSCERLMKTVGRCEEVRRESRF
jgi:hypothetical protein